MKTGLSLAVMAAVVFAGIWLHASLQQRTWRKQWERCVNDARLIVDGVKAQFPGCGDAVCAVTTEPGLRPTGLAQSNITLEDFVDALDRIEPAETPLSSLATNEVKLSNTYRDWNVDSFPGPKGANGRADRETVTTGDARDWSANVRKMGNVGQGFSETWGAGWQADIPKIAGVTDIASYGKTSAYMMLKQHMEVAFSSLDQTALFDAGPKLGAIMAGYYKLTAYANRYTGSASGYAIGKATDLHYAPSGADITGTIAANHSRSMWKSLALTLRTAAKQNTNWMAICGLTLRQAVCDLTDPTTVTATAAATGTGAVVGTTATQVRVMTAAESDTELGCVIDVINTPNGRFMVTQTDWIGTTTTDSGGGALTGWAAASGQRAQAAFVSVPSSGLIVKKGNLFKTWGKTPYTVQLGQDGGGDTFDSKCLATLGVRNPILAGAIRFTS